MPNESQTTPGTDWIDRAASLQAQLNQVRRWRSWYANGEAPSPSEWRELDRLLSTEGV